MKILLNSLGIQDSGGITVFENILNECAIEKSINYHIMYNDNPNMKILVTKYQDVPNFEFHSFKAKSFLHRLYYENIIFRDVINDYNINLIYNFSGSAQFFLQVPQILKMQNLLFYSKKLDEIYKQNNQLVLWIKQIYLKKLSLRFQYPGYLNEQFQCSGRMSSMI